MKMIKFRKNGWISSILNDKKHENVYEYFGFRGIAVDDWVNRNFAGGNVHSDYVKTINHYLLEPHD